VCACLHTSDSAHHCVWLLYELLAEVAKDVAAVQGCGLVEEVLVGIRTHTHTRIRIRIRIHTHMHPHAHAHTRTHTHSFLINRP